MTIVERRESETKWGEAEFNLRIATMLVQARGVTIIRATLAIPNVFRLLNAVYPLISLYSHLDDVMIIANDVASGGMKTKAMRQRISLRRAASGGPQHDDNGAEDKEEEETDDALSSADKRVEGQEGDSVFRAMSSQRISELSTASKRCLAVAIDIFAACIFVLAISSALRNTGSACDSSHDVLKRCVLRSNTLSPFRDAKKCPCIAFYADCKSFNSHRGLGVFRNGAEALDELQ